MASSSWSHAFLTEKNHWIYPDLAADRVMLEQLRAGEYTAWRDVPLAPRKTLSVRGDWTPAEGHRLTGGVNCGRAGTWTHCPLAANCQPW